MNEFYIIGGVLAVSYTAFTSKKEDFKELGFWVCLLILSFLFIGNWFSFCVSISSDVVSNREKMLRLESKLKDTENETRPK